MDGTVHHPDNILRNGHTQACALQFTDAGILCPGEWFKYPGDEIIGYPYPIVDTDKFKLAFPRRRCVQFIDAQYDLSSFRGILDRIGQKIHEDLLQPVAVSNDILMPYLADTDLKFLLFFCHQRAAHVRYILDQLRQIDLFRRQIDFPAFNL